ncbi:MAG: hypothetical protein ACREM1_24830 [Longimicrobiales bacterium]
MARASVRSANRLRKVETKYGRFLLGHSINAGTPGIEVSEGRYLYLGLVPEDLVAAAAIGTC